MRFVIVVLLSFSFSAFAVEFKPDYECISSKNSDDIIKFAGLEKFADTKLKNFSSGMQMRLAFATAVQVDPTVLLLDEVIAVGDLNFQKKCLQGW